MIAKCIIPDVTLLDSDVPNITLAVFVAPSIDPDGLNANPNHPSAVSSVPDFFLSATNNTLAVFNVTFVFCHL